MERRDFIRAAIGGLAAAPALAFEPPGPIPRPALPLFKPAANPEPQLAPERLQRAKFRIFLRMLGRRSYDAKLKAAVAKVLAEPKLFDLALEGVTAEYEAARARGEVLQDLLAWLWEHKVEIAKLILTIVMLFLDDESEAEPAK